MIGADSLLAWLESTRIATTVGGSAQLTALLSATHLLGMALVGGSALFSSLRLLGLLLPDQPLHEVTAAPARALPIGLAISVATGFLLVAPRASAAAQNGYFQIKMALLATAVAFHFSFYKSVRAASSGEPLVSRLTGIAVAGLWLGVVGAGCAFILLE
jgi:hypothetical protein